MRANLPFEPTAEGVRLSVRLTPRAARAGIDGVARDATGAAYLRVRVGEPPENGKANRALIALLAKEWRLPASSIDLVGGAKARRKTLRLRGDAGALARKLRALSDQIEPI